MQNYNETISKVRDLARDQVRLHAVNRYRTELYGLEKLRASMDADKESYKKSILRCEFKKSQVVDADPDKEDKLIKLDEEIKFINGSIELVDKQIENNTNAKTALIDKIAKVETGEIKMSTENVENAAKTLIDEFVKSQAKEIAAA